MQFARSRMLNMRRLLTGVPLLLAALSVGAEVPSSLQIHGFATQTFNYTSANQFFGDTEDGSFEFRELGINASYRLRSDLMVSGQIVSRHAGEVDDGSPRLDFGLVDYTVDQSLDGRWGVRLGRIKIPTGLYNVTRDVDHTRPSIILPQSVYLDRSRSMLLSADMMLVYSEHQLDHGDLFIEAGYGLPHADDEDLERGALLGYNWEGKLDGKPSFSFQTLYESTDGHWTAALTFNRAALEFDATAADRAIGLLGGDLDIEYRMLSLRYETADWNLTGEFLRQHNVARGFGPLLPDGSADGDNWYIQGGIRPKQNVELIARYERSYSNNADKAGNRAASFSGAYQAIGLPGIANHNKFSKDFMIGLRWDPDPQWVLRAEHHWVDGTNWLSRIENPNPTSQQREWRLFMLSAGYSF